MYSTVFGHDPNTVFFMRRSQSVKNADETDKDLRA